MTRHPVGEWKDSWHDALPVQAPRILAKGNLRLRDPVPDVTGVSRIVLRWRAVITSLLLLTTGLALIVYLAVISGVGANFVAETLITIDPVPVLALIALSAFYVLCGAEKWRLVDVSLRRDERAELSRSTTFALSGLGMILSNLLPSQFGTALARTLGTYVTGHKVVVRGVLGTFMEQAFDVALVCVLAPISLLALTFRGPLLGWTAIAIVAVVSVSIMSGRMLRYVADLSRRDDGDSFARRWPRVARRIGDLDRSGLLNPRLVRRLWALSSARFVALVLIAAASGWAAGLDVSTLHLAGAMPFAVVATALSPTPAGLGTNEFAYSSMLHAFGTPLDVAVQWAIINRILMVVASVAVGLLGVIVAVGVGLLRQRSSDHVARR
jgi:uncharacterized membrane protein YbhN (UPF0104 family)